ncbi:MAG: hypothetical protein D6741_01950 [Planctomycetota bacterium]|nr:MAG: hypothetical protein D6741_01950 [Planctomycetota bacterium]
MPTTRVLFGLSLAAGILALAWLDWQTLNWPGVWLFPVLFLCVAVAGVESIRLFPAAGVPLFPRLTIAGSLAMITACWGTALGWIATHRDFGLTVRLAREVVGASSVVVFVAMASVVAGAFLTALARYRKAAKDAKPCGALAAAVGTTFAVAYVGLLSCFLIQLRMAFGMKALVSLLVVIKLSDTGAFTAGKLFGKHPMAPVLSPNKTIEGAIGAVVSGIAASCLVFLVLVPWLAKAPFSGSWISVVLYGLVLSVVGIWGDLAESLLKREADTKDSSRLIPGLGGALDLLDSTLLAAPVAYLFWLFWLF